MMMHRVLITALLLSFGGTIAVRAQTETERQALARIKESAEKGDSHAQLELGMIYATGARGSRDLAKAAKWHRKAADQGLAPAQYQVGLDYAYGAGVKINQVEAAKWF